MRFPSFRQVETHDKPQETDLDPTQTEQNHFPKVLAGPAAASGVEVSISCGGGNSRRGGSKIR